jgi:uncharacterized protein (DUF779 family)
MIPARVACTEITAQWLKKLEGIHGPLLFHQSGGCCDGSSPMCYPRNEFKIGDEDVFLGWIAETPFYISGSQFEYWSHTKLVIDVVPGRGGGFSVEAPEGIRFLTRSDVFTEAEEKLLTPPAKGQQHERV